MPGLACSQWCFVRVGILILKLIPDSIWALRRNRHRCKSEATPSWDVGSWSGKFFRHKGDVPELNVLAPGWSPNEWDIPPRMVRMYSGRLFLWAWTRLRHAVAHEYVSFYRKVGNPTWEVWKGILLVKVSLNNSTLTKACYKSLDFRQMLIVLGFTPVTQLEDIRFDDLPDCYVKKTWGSILRSDSRSPIADHSSRAFHGPWVGEPYSRNQERGVRRVWGSCRS